MNGTTIDRFGTGLETAWAAPVSRRRVAMPPPAPTRVLVIGPSKQRPDSVGVYHLIGTTADGTNAILSRHDGGDYSASMDALSPYREALATMVSSVMEHLPPALRSSAPASLIQRWNRQWGVTALAAKCAVCELERRETQMSLAAPADSASVAQA